MSDYIYVLGKDGSPQMPTTRRRHVLKLLNTGKARIAEHVPFTIQLLYDNTPHPPASHFCRGSGADKHQDGSPIPERGSSYFCCL